MNEIQNNGRIESLITTTTPYCMAPLTNKCVGILTVGESEVYKSLKNRRAASTDYVCQGFPKDVIQEIIVRCSIPDFLSLSCTNASHYVIAQETLQNKSLVQVQFCPKLTILNPFNFKNPVNLFKVLQWYYKLDSTVENDESEKTIMDPTSERKDDSITLQIYPKLTLNEWIEIGKKNGVKVLPRNRDISDRFGEIVEDGESEWEMISNALVKGTRWKISETQDRQLGKRGYHKKPPLGSYLHLIIFTQKVFEECLFKESPSVSTWGCTSTNLDDPFVFVVGGSFKDEVSVNSVSKNLAYQKNGAAGLRKI